MDFTKKLFLFFTLIIFSAYSEENVPANDNAAEQSEPKAVGIVVTANPLATESGLEILRAGGSAVDAAIAVQATLSLVEPQSSGLAGGGFMVHYDADTKNIEYYNGREKAPMGATPSLSLMKMVNQSMGVMPKTAAVQSVHRVQLRFLTLPIRIMENFPGQAFLNPQ